MSIFDVTLYENLPWQFTSLFVLLGAAIGSFFNVLSLRWPAYQVSKNDAESKYWLKLRGMLTKADTPSTAEAADLMSGRSKCPCCRKPIPYFLNVPLISWIMLRGRSACCKTPISPRYLAYELFGGLVFLGIALTVGPSVSGLLLGILLMVLSLAVVIDLSDSFIPENLLFVGFFLSYGLALSPIGIGIETAFIAHLCTFFGLYLIFGTLGKLMGKDLVGTGDFHLLALAASMLGASAWMLPILILPFALLTWLLFKAKVFPRGLFSAVIGPGSIPAGPAIVLSTFCLIAMRITGVYP